MRRVGLCVFCVALSEVLVAQQPNCQEVAAMARMAKAASGAQLTTWKQKAGVGYRARLVFSSRMFELHSDRRTAAQGPAFPAVGAEAVNKHSGSKAGATDSPD